MSGRFLKLSRSIINLSHITHVTREPNKYTLFLSNPHVGGFFLFGGGGIYSDRVYFEACKEKNTEDYNTIDRWINTL